MSWWHRPCQSSTFPTLDPRLPEGQTNRIFKEDSNGKVFRNLNNDVKEAINLSSLEDLETKFSNHK